ncbi:penicillin-binding protein 1A [Bacteriovorax sp. DB6_IX]|uniref:penicillin-binding protein 1A n=1 Tax=Bacteriovorax sp. DB6_IX TaxID=1353530 RepID=UPI00038A1AE4|nr:PBP1A family penicillin-binding protein [Bacteriovorax sp. DB6_IX]EQC51445.1 penicillin-binding protein, 1A family [Bacteriovorax sp. DB6_IX]
MKKILSRLLLLGSFTALIGGLFVFSVMIYFSFSLPKISSLADYKPAIKSQILSKDGAVLAEIGVENRDIVQINEIPKLIVDAFLSAEDANFYDHTGVNYLGIMRAMLANIKAGRVVQGGSTITQQVAKSLLLSRERSVTRKIKDFLLAQKIEKRFSKDEILFLYLNQVYLGGGYYGVKSAYRGYFDKELSETTVAEAALIAGLLVAPGKYSPYINPKFAKTRQNYVLGRMLANGKITKEQYEEAVNEKIKYRIKRGEGFKAAYFTEYVRQQVVDLVGEENFLRNGFKVLTTLDYDLQKVAEKEIREGARDIDKRQGFNGPIGFVPEEKRIEHYQKFRKELYQDNSHYFILNDELNRSYEINFNEEELKDILAKKNEERASLYNSRFRAGNISDDPLLAQLNKGDFHNAVVEAVDDRARIIYVSLGGVTGIIPYSEFRWAHERSLSEDRQYFPYVTSPSSIVKAGDIIRVKILEKKTSLQSQVWRGFKSYLEKSRDKEFVKKQSYLLCSLEQEPEVQAALLSLNPFTGEVVSMVGGTDYDKSKFNRALQSKRQPGSAFKPALFAAGLENGYTPNTIILDTPEALGGADSSLNWKPRNYDGKFKGAMTFRNSLELSRNIPTIKIALDLGMSKIHEFLKRTGFDAEMPNDLSISLGSFGATLLEMVKAYSIYPNGGKKVVPKFITSIVDREGKEYYIQDETPAETEEKVVESSEELDVEKAAQEMKAPEGEEEKEEKVNPFYLSLNEEQVYDPRLAYIMTNLLKGVVHNGTGRRAKQVSNFLGGKTGTTSSYVDAWFMGFSQNIVTGVWAGFDNNKTMGWGETGSKSALPIWSGYMRESIKKYGERDFQIPLGILNVYVDKQTGRVAEQNEPNAFLESFVEGTEPGNDSISSYFKKKEAAKSEGDIFEDEEYYKNQ